MFNDEDCRVPAAGKSSWLGACYNRCYNIYLKDMKHLQLISLIVCVGFCVSCESTKTAGQGNQERKRLAAIQQQESEQMDQGERNLWNAQRDLLVRDNNPTFPYH